MNVGSIIYSLLKANETKFLNGIKVSHTYSVYTVDWQKCKKLFDLLETKQGSNILNIIETRITLEYLLSKNMIHVSDKIFRVVSYNVQEWMNLDFGNIPWSVKYKKYNKELHDSHNEIYDLIKSLNPDVLGIQEASNSTRSQKQYIRLENDGYDMQTCKADSGWFGQLENPIFVKSTYPKINSSAVNITGTGSDRPRCMSVYKTNIHGLDITFINLHLSYKKDHQLENAQNVINYINNLSPEDRKYLVVMGDFNSVGPVYKSSDVGAVWMLFYNNGFKDAFTVLRDQTGRDIPPSRMSNHKIDHIFLSPDWDLSQIKVVSFGSVMGGQSDHLPIYIDFQIQ